VLVNGQLVNFLSGLTAEAPAVAGIGRRPPPVTMMQPGEVVRLRILNGSNALLFPIVLPGFDVYLIANDGVNVLAPQTDRPRSNVQIASAIARKLLVRAPQRLEPTRSPAWRCPTRRIHGRNSTSCSSSSAARR